MNSYAKLKSETLGGVKECLDAIVKERTRDIKDFDNLKNVFMSGRKVGKIPSASSDIADDDRLGDFSYDDAYLYIVIDDTGAAWRRIELETW